MNKFLLPILTSTMLISCDSENGRNDMSKPEDQKDYSDSIQVRTPADDREFEKEKKVSLQPPAWSKYSSAVCRVAVFCLCTAMAKACLVPTNTTNFLARVIPV